MPGRANEVERARVCDIKLKYQKENQLLFKVDIEDINQNKCETTLKIVLTKFPKAEGYQRNVLLSNSETRYLKSTEHTMEVLAAIPVFESLGEQ